MYEAEVDKSWWESSLEIPNKKRVTCSMRYHDAIVRDKLVNLLLEVVSVKNTQKIAKKCLAQKKMLQMYSNVLTYIRRASASDLGGFRGFGMIIFKFIKKYMSCNFWDLRLISILNVKTLMFCWRDPASYFSCKPDVTSFLFIITRIHKTFCAKSEYFVAKLYRFRF